MRVFYSSLFYLLTPAILSRLLWRSINIPEHRYRWRERLAFYTKEFPHDVIWFHAVSVGEAEASFPLIRQLQKQHPGIKLLITTTTPTASARVKAVLSNTVEHVYLPYDIPDAVNRFMQCFKPKLAVIMETEIWPNLFIYCGKNGIPLYIVNAHLSEKASQRLKKFPALIAPVLASVKLIAAQTQDDANRFIAIGADSDKVKTFGNIKFDVEIPADIIERGLQLKTGLFSGRFVWLIASTHKNEEAIFLEIYKEIKLKIPEILLIIAPRHPERFSEVKKLSEQRQLKVVTRTSGKACHQETDVYLVDTMGELKMLYAAADVAFVGGSMVPAGGHNILEAAAVGTPVLFGPFMANFKDIAKEALQQNVAIQCQNKEDIITAICTLYADPAYREDLSKKGKAFIRQNQGITAKICALLSQHI